MLAELVRAHPLKKKPLLLWKNSLRVSAGMAYYRLNAIGLSPHVLIDEERLYKTLAHEYAHLLAYDRYGKKGTGHGQAWQRAMVDLGEEPEVRHNYDVVRNTQRQQVRYRCERCGSFFDRHRRLPRRRKYVHVNCGGSLALVGIREIT